MCVRREAEKVCARCRAAVILKAAGNDLLFSLVFLWEPTEFFTNYRKPICPTVVSEELTLHQQRTIMRRGAGDTSKMGSLAAPQGVHAAFRLLPVPEDSGLPSLFAFALAANSCFTLRAIASVSTL